ncbi:MAG: trypsin-like peptidase domain-containing protein [Bacteroidota bacterium]
MRNDYKFAEASGSGASAFLVKSKKDTLLCTAKHLLGEAMGIEPEIKTTEFNSALHYWKAFPNTDKLSTDTIVGTKLITEKINDIDIILQECKLGKNNTILPLTPRFKDAKYGERFEIIGCEYIDFDCHQRIYYATAETYEGGQLFLRSKTDFNPVGFSGAPVIDAKGFVIGILSGGAEFQGNLYLAIEPLSKVKTYLQ